MSKIAIKGNASGTGTFTLEAPNSNTDRTLVLPDEAGTVLTSASDLPAANLTGDIKQNAGAAFLVYATAAQQISAATVTKVVFDTAQFDEGSDYNLSTDRFQPSIAGYYQLTFTLLQASGNGSNVRHYYYKNGSLFAQPFHSSTSTTSWSQSSAFIPMNGTTDYVEVYMQWSNTQNIYNDSNLGSRGSNLQGHLVRTT